MSEARHVNNTDNVGEHYASCLTGHESAAPMARMAFSRLTEEWYTLHRCHKSRSQRRFISLKKAANRPLNPQRTNTYPDPDDATTG